MTVPAGREELWPEDGDEARPYGVEALIRDNSGNWLVLVEPRDYTEADFNKD